jgi:hypothetical protein
METVFARNDSDDIFRDFLVVAANVGGKLTDRKYPLGGIGPVGGIGPEVVRRVSMPRAFAVAARL